VICANRQNELDIPPTAFGQPGRAHLVGAGGAGMRSLANLLGQDGWKLTGSDAAQGPTSDWNRYVAPGAAVGADVDLLIHSDAVPAQDPERRRAAALGIPSLSYPMALGRLMATGRGLAVAGTHGKSTTTAMLSGILRSAGADPSYVFGAQFQDGAPGGRRGQGEWLVAEACEYRENFRHLHPEMAVLLAIEPDHFDYYRTWAQLTGAFVRFAAKLPPEGFLFFAADCPAARGVARFARCRSESVALDDAGADWQAEIGRVVSGRCEFLVRRAGRPLGNIALAVPGRHNAVNALAAIAAACRLGASWRAIAQGLAGFGGLARRLQTIHESGRLAVVDDYAHLPTEISAALATVRRMYPGRRLWCVFQPHQASRTRYLLDELATSLQNADKLVVAEIFRAREGAASPGEVRAADLARRAAALGADVARVHSADDIMAVWDRGSQAGDVVVTLGAGDIGNLAHGIAQRL
jgi:UDP-N-acetylmuramate--alanine ligase